MVATPLTPITKIGPYPTLPVTANSLDWAWEVGDAVDDNSITVTGTTRYLLLVRNTHATDPFTFTIVSEPDDLNRVGDIGPYTLQAGEFAHFWFSSTVGWNNGTPDNEIVFSCESDDIEYALFTL